MTLLELPPNPSHVLMPTGPQMDAAIEMGLIVPRRWSKKDCPVCRGTETFRMWEGIRPHTAEMARTADIADYACPCEDQLVLSRWMGVRGIPRLYQMLRPSDGVWLKADDLDWVQKRLTYATQHGRSYSSTVISGSSGAGKTYAAALELKLLMHLGMKRSAFINASMADHFARFNSRKFEEAESWWGRRIRGADHLVINDLGKEKGTEAAMHALRSLIMDRTDDGSTTVITTNLSLEDLTERYKGGVRSAIDAGDFHEMKHESLSDEPKNVARIETDRGISRPATLI